MEDKFEAKILDLKYLNKQDLNVIKKGFEDANSSSALLLDENSIYFMDFRDDTYRTIFLIYYNDNLIGFINYQLQQLIKDDQLIIAIDTLYVLKEYRKQGHGTFLLNCIFNQAKIYLFKSKQETIKVVLEVKKENLYLDEFYKKLGFIEKNLRYTKEIKE